jgi:hypothetical protein
MIRPDAPKSARLMPVCPTRTIPENKEYFSTKKGGRRPFFIAALPPAFSQDNTGPQIN